jgi:hypothetical protein
MYELDAYLSNLGSSVNFGLLVAAAAILSTVGCAVTPLKTIERSSVKTIGWHTTVDNQILNVHTGITVFGNFSKPIPNNWELSKFLARQSQVAIEKAGYSYRALALTPPELAWFSDSRCFNTWDGSYKVAMCGDEIAGILRKYQVDALILSVSGNQGDPTNGPADLTGIGIFTRGTDRPNMLMPYATVWHQIYAGNPATPRQSWACVRGQQRDPSPWAKPVAELEASDLEWLKSELKTLLSTGFDNALVAAGLAYGPAPLCPDVVPVANQY